MHPTFWHHHMKLSTIFCKLCAAQEPGRWDTKLHTNLIMFGKCLMILCWTAFMKVLDHTWLSGHGWTCLKSNLIEFISLIYLNLHRNKHLRLLKYSEIIRQWFRQLKKKAKIVVSNWVWITPHIFSVRRNDYNMVILQDTLKLYHLQCG